MPIWGTVVDPIQLHGEVRSIAERLPSAKIRRELLLRDALPAAARDERLIVAHRWTLWGLSPSRDAGRRGLLFSNNPVSKHLSADMVALIRDWIARRLG